MLSLWPGVHRSARVCTVQAEAQRLYSAGIETSQRSLVPASVSSSMGGVTKNGAFSQTSQGEEREQELSRGLYGGKSAGKTIVRLRPGVQGVFREFQSIARPLRVTAGRNQGGLTEREPTAWRWGLCSVPRGRY